MTNPGFLFREQVMAPCLLYFALGARSSLDLKTNRGNIMKQALAILVLSLFFAGTAHADIISCNLEKKSKLERRVAHSIRAAQQSLDCGDHMATYENLITALQQLDEVMAGGATGYCYSKDSCRGAKVSGQKVTRAECEATGVGESWQQVDPLGACTDI